MMNENKLPERPTNLVDDLYAARKPCGLTAPESQPGIRCGILQAYTAEQVNGLGCEGAFCRITVNMVKHEVPNEPISYAKLMELAGNPGAKESLCEYYFLGGSRYDESGFLTHGESVMPIDGMNFSVSERYANRPLAPLTRGVPCRCGDNFGSHHWESNGVRLQLVCQSCDNCMEYRVSSLYDTNQ
jgi:hypothetical protein